MFPLQSSTPKIIFKAPDQQIRLVKKKRWSRFNIQLGGLIKKYQKSEVDVREQEREWLKVNNIVLLT